MSLLGVFFRHRHVPLPTLWGWLAMAALTAILAVGLGRHAYLYLAVNEPARGRSGEGARLLVVEGWLFASDLNQVLPVIARGHYDRILTTGGPIETWDGVTTWPHYAERAASYLRSLGVARVPVVAVGAPASAQDRSYLSAVMVRDWLDAHGEHPAAIDVFTAGVHARRSRMVYRLAFGPGTEIGVMAARADSFDPERWWQSSNGVKTVIGEGLSLGWTACCFWPPARGSHEERWAVPAAASSPQH